MFGLYSLGQMSVSPSVKYPLRLDISCSVLRAVFSSEMALASISFVQNGEENGLPAVLV